MSSGETILVGDLTLSIQPSCVPGSPLCHQWGAIWQKSSIEEARARLSDHGYCSSAPAELAMVSTRSVLGFFLNSRTDKVVLVVRGCCHHEKTIRESSASGETL